MTSKINVGKIKEIVKNSSLGRRMERFLLSSFSSPHRLINVLEGSLGVILTYRCNSICKYCFSRGLQSEYPQDMKLEDFAYILRWMGRNGRNRVRLLGGEPTIYPHFGEMIDLCRREGVLVHLYTNGLFGPDVRQHLTADTVKLVWANYGAYTAASPDNQARILRNLDEISRRGITLLFSHTIDAQENNWSQLITMAKTYQVHHVRFSVSIPGFTQQVRANRIHNDINVIAERSLELVRRSEDAGVRCIFYRPIPTCMFTDSQWRLLSRRNPYFGYTRCPLGYMGDYSLLVTVNPDLSIYPCTSVFLKGPHLSHFQNTAEISAFYRKSLTRLLASPTAPYCTDCPAHGQFIESLNRVNDKAEDFFSYKLCQGGCLSFRSDC